MVSFNQFSYEFDWKFIQNWKTVLVKAFHGTNFSLKFKGKYPNPSLTLSDIPCTNSGFDKAISMFSSQFSSNVDIDATVTFTSDRIWDQLSFWNMLPVPNWKEIKPSSIQEKDEQRVAVAISTIKNFIESMKPGSEMLMRKKGLDIPFEHISTILGKINDEYPIKCMYYSPSSSLVVVSITRDQSDYRFSITPDHLTNSCGYILDFDDGIVSKSDAGVPSEMTEDFKMWLWGTKYSPELFKLRTPFL